MSARTLAQCGALLALSSCGYIGIELKDLPATDGAAPRDGEDASLELDASPALDARADSAPPFEYDAAAAADAEVGDAAIADGATPADAATDAGRDAGTVACDLTGSWAMKISTNVTWPAGFLDVGNATATTWLLFTGTQSGGTWSGSTTACGFVLPDFELNPVLGVDEAYAVRVPDTLFDRTPPYITPVGATMSISGASVPGASVNHGPQTFVIGASLANPGTDAWPTKSAIAQADTDMDGQGGVTANYLQDASHVYPPLDINRSARADRSNFAVRLSYSGAGVLTSCSQIDGSMEFSHFDTHVLGCRVAGGATCSTTQADFLDDNRPLYVPSASTYRAIEVPASTTCSQVRSTLLP